MDKKEYKILKEKYGYNFLDFVPITKTKIYQLIVFVSDNRRLHDSGYPFIRIFGDIGKKRLIDLGWHDHYIIEYPVNIDSYGKNIFRIMPLINKFGGFWVRGNNIWVSSFQIKSNGELV